MTKNNPKEKSGNRKYIITIIILALIAASSISYIIYSQVHLRHGNPNFIGGAYLRIDNSTLNDIENFFNSNPNNQSLQDYCSQNPGYCEYYCTKVNPNNNLCNNIPHQGYNRSSYGAPMMRYPRG